MGSFYFFTAVLRIKHIMCGVDYEYVYTEFISPKTRELQTVQCPLKVLQKQDSNIIFMCAR